MLETRRPTGRVIEAEHNRAVALAREIPDLRVVAVDDEDGTRIELPRDASPALGYQLELAVPVELVAEEVPQAHRPRLHSSGNVGQCGFVDLEQPQLRAVRREERRRDSREQVRPGAVVRELDPRGKDLGDHRRRRRLPVRGRDDG